MSARASRSLTFCETCDGIPVMSFASIAFEEGSEPQLRVLNFRVELSKLGCQIQTLLNEQILDRILESFSDARS